MIEHGLEETIEYIKTFIIQRDLNGKELLIITMAYQAGMLRGVNEAHEALILRGFDKTNIEKDKDK